MDVAVGGSRLDTVPRPSCMREAALAGPKVASQECCVPQCHAGTFRRCSERVGRPVRVMIARQAEAFCKAAIGSTLM